MNFLQQRIIDLCAEDCRRFLMRQESFCNIGLPKYFNFQKLLDALSEKYREVKVYSDLEKIRGGKNRPNELQDVNYLFFQNKDGRYSWRPLQIINPAIYACLVNKITEPKNWQLIIDRFKEFEELDRIKCYSLPQINLSNHTDTANNALSWWNDIEQQSIELAMDYNYLMITDILDCYGSIYTHSITWSMCGIDNAKIINQSKRKNLSKEEKEDIKNSISDYSRIEKEYELGDTIDNFIMAMSYNQTNGIPQGSVLMDFIAELVLGYVDLRLSESLQKEDYIDNYRILRYRDDYRIFANTQEDVVRIAKILTIELSKLNFKLNTQKTVLSQDLVCDSIKPDKLYYITRDYKQLEVPITPYTLEKHLLRINQLAKKYPNSGSLQKAMDIFFKRICNMKELDLFKEANSAEVLISIVTNIAYNNPKVYKQYVAIISKILSVETNRNNKEKILKQIIKKFETLPNVGYLEIWLQRLTIKDNRKNSFSEPLCKYLAKEKASIWNIDWLKSDIKELFCRFSIVDEEEIDRLPDAIEYKEIEIFSKY